MFNYIGPGLGGGIIAVIIGIIVTLLSFLIAVFWVPIKKIILFIKKNISKK